MIFDFGGFYETNRRLFGDFLYWIEDNWNMGCICSKIINDVSNIEVLDYTPPAAKYDYLRPKGTIIVKIDEKWKVPVIHFDFDGWSQNSIRLWPKDNM